MLIMLFVSFRDARLCIQYNGFGTGSLQGVVVFWPFLCIQNHFFTIELDEQDRLNRPHSRLFIEVKSHSQPFL